MITRMNHAVLYVRDARAQQAFYGDVLGFSTIVEHPDGQFVFMRAPASENHHDIAFFSIGASAGPSTAGRTSVGMYHIAWEVGTIEDLAAMRDRLADAGALKGASDHGANKSLYAVDPDGLEFEVMFLVPAADWGDEANEAIIRPLDLPGEVERFRGQSMSSDALSNHYCHFFDDAAFKDTDRPGFRQRVITGDQLQLCFWRITGGSTGSYLHHHTDNEQLGIIVRGQLDFRIGQPENKDRVVLSAGDCYLVPQHVWHGDSVFIGDEEYGECWILDVFAPPRADLGEGGPQ